MTDAANFFKDHFGGLKQSGAARVSSEMELIETSPQDAIQSHRVGRELGLPSGVIDTDPAQYEQNLRRQENAAILNSAPITAEWLADHENQRISRDKIAELSAFEQNFGALGRAVGRSTRQIGAGVESSFAAADVENIDNIGMTFEEILAEERANGRIDEMEAQGFAPHSIAQAETRAADMAHRRFGFSQRFAGRDREEVLAQAAERYASAQRLFQVANEIPMSETAEAFRDGALSEAPDTFLGALGAFASDPIGGLVFIGETAAETLPILAVATATTAATGQPLAGATVAGVGGALRESSIESMSFVQEFGEFDVTTPEGAAAVLANEDLMAEAKRRGLVRGVIIGVMDGLSGGIASATLAKSPAGDVLVQSLAQSFMGGAGEAAAQFALDGEISAKDVVVEALAEVATLPIELGGVGGKPLLRQLGRFGRSGQTATEIATLDKLAEDVAEIKEAAPERFQDLMERVDQSGTYFQLPASEVETFFQSDVPDETLKQLGVERTDYEAALSTGSTVEVSASNYVTHFANTEFGETFQRHAVIDQDEMSIAEAEAFEQTAQEDVSAALAPGEELVGAADTPLSVTERLEEQIVASGSVSPEVAQFQSRIAGGIFETLAQRTGRDADEFANNFGLEIRGVSDIPPGGAADRGAAEVPAAVPSPPDIDTVFQQDGAADVQIDVELDDGSTETVSAAQARETLEARRADANSLLECLRRG